jgi:hypothetical protein
MNLEVLKQLWTVLRHLVTICIERMMEL